MILRKISFWIVEAVYPLIPSLYNIFKILAENKFFTEEQIANLSNNIYIFISVCMLFAFGIRLLNGIVNPELLDEKKKGVKSVFFNAFAAVIMIIIVPIGFRMLYSIQDRIVENHLIEKIFLGTELTDKQDPGQIIAAYAFSAFCYPNEEVTSEGLDSTGQDYYNKTLTDISNVKKLTSYITKGKGLLGKDPEYDLEYNSILAPAAGIVILYELIIMCIDLALRSVKLGLLQLIAPIILCGYIFKGTELLQKWIKEVITTWVLLFLKVAMVVFMVYGLALLPGFLEKIEFPEGSGKITKGLVKMFILIGLLQVIKQLPNIINSVFGTNIQSRGGIKGRLGEMATIGGMAQQAWTGLGRKAAGIAGTAGGLALGAGAGLVRNGFQALKTGYNENYKGKDLKAKAATAGDRMKSHGSKAWSGIKATGKSIIHPVETAKKVGGAIKANGVDTLKKGAMTGLRGLATAGEVMKAGAGAGGFGAGVKAGRDLSNVKVPNVISDDNLGTSHTHATRRVSGLDEEKGTITKNTRGKFAETARRLKEVSQDSNLTEAQKKAKIEEIRNNGDTAKGYAKKAVDGESNILSNNQRNVTTDYIEAKGKLTELKKADDAKNAMASILSQIGSSLSMTPGQDGSWATNMSQAIADKAGTFDLNRVMKETLNHLNTPDLQSKFEESLKTLQNNQDMFLSCQTSLHTNFDGVKMSTSKDLNSQITSADIATSNAETLFNSVRDASSNTEKTAMNRAVTAGNTLFAMMPEYQQYEDNQVQFTPEVRSSTGTIATDAVWDLSPGADSRNLTRLQQTQTQQTQTQQTQQTQLPNGNDSGESVQTQSQPYSHQPTDASNPEHQADGSYTPGIYSGGTVNANVDLSGLEQRLDQINNSVNTSGQNVTKAVNAQGGTIANKLTEANTTLKRIDTGIGNMSSSIGNLGSSIDDLKSLTSDNDDDDDE